MVDATYVFQNTTVNSDTEQLHNALTQPIPDWFISVAAYKNVPKWFPAYPTWTSLSNYRSYMNNSLLF